MLLKPSLRKRAMAEMSNPTMSTETTKVRVWQLRETPAAIECAKTLPASLGAGVLTCWIPRSLCEHISRRLNPGQPWPELTITMQAWKARQLNLEEVD